jgi:hypothetical protein
MIDAVICVELNEEDSATSLVDSELDATSNVVVLVENDPDETSNVADLKDKDDDATTKFVRPVPTDALKAPIVVLNEELLVVICVAKDELSGEIDADRDCSEADVIAAEELFADTTEVREITVAVSEELFAVI